MASGNCKLCKLYAPKVTHELLLVIIVHQNCTQINTACYGDTMDCTGTTTTTSFQNAPSCCDKRQSYADNQDQCIICSTGGKCIALHVLAVYTVCEYEWQIQRVYLKE